MSRKWRDPRTEGRRIRAAGLDTQKISAQCPATDGHTEAEESEKDGGAPDSGKKPNGQPVPSKGGQMDRQAGQHGQEGETGRRGGREEDQGGFNRGKPAWFSPPGDPFTGVSVIRRAKFPANSENRLGVLFSGNKTPYHPTDGYREAITYGSTHLGRDGACQRRQHALAGTRRIQGEGRGRGGTGGEGGASDRLPEHRHGRLLRQ